MLHDAATTAVGLVVGLLTGYFFEWRNSKSTREYNVELEAKLRVLRESIYSIGRGPSHDHVASDEKVDLEEEVHRWLVAYQGPDGTIPRVRVLRRFLDNGHAAEHINAALVKLDERGVLRLGEMIEVQ